MKRPVLITFTSAMLLAVLLSLSWDESSRVRMVTTQELAALKGGDECYYPNPIVCQNALPEVQCINYCNWYDNYGFEYPDPLWGYHGHWYCPDSEYQITNNPVLTTTQKTGDSSELGWNEDEEKPEPEDCNIIYWCNCDPNTPPGYGNYESYCLPNDPPLPVSPTATYRRVKGEQECQPDGYF